MFINNHFKEETLIQNGFLITNDNPLKHLKNRKKTEIAITDIYLMGLSIHETKINFHFFGAVKVTLATYMSKWFN